MGAVRRAYVHIGPPKTGTTFLQSALWTNRAVLLQRGVLVPRPQWQAQRRAVAHLMRRGPGVPARPDSGGPRDAWDRLVREVDASTAHTVVLSAELLCQAESHDAQALVESFAPAPVHIVHAARDLAAMIPAGWQTQLRNRRSPSWPEFLASVRDPAGPGTYGDTFWRLHDPARSLPPFLEHLPTDRVHVVTVPPPGSAPGLLWERLCSIVGIEAAGYDLDSSRANVSLGGVESEVLRRLTVRTKDALPARDYADLVKRFIAREVLEDRAQSFRLVLPEREREWLDPRARSVADYLRTGGFDVVGDLDELTPAAVPAAREPDDVSDDEVLAVMEDVLSATLREMAGSG